MRPSLLGALVLLAAAVAGCNDRPHLQLQIAAGGDRVVWSTPIALGERFHVSFVHSQEKVRWSHHYLAAAGPAIVQDGSTFGSYGAGMPMSPVERRNASFIASGVQHVGSIPMLSWRAAGTELNVHGTNVSLDQWFGDYERFEIRIR
jgi:hypothetical protein